MKDIPGEHERTNPEEVTPAMEDYLKVIFDLNNTKRVVRVKDIARKMDVKMPSVTSMLQKLANHGLVRYKKYEYVELVDMGACYAREVCRRYEILLRFLSDILTVEKKTAAEEACKMEHLLSPETLGTLTDLMNFMESCPKARERLPVRFKLFRENGCRLGLCKQSDANTARVG